MLTPYQLDNIANDATELYAEFETSVLNDVSRRIAKMDYVTATAEFQLLQLQESAILYKDTIVKISKLLGKSEKEVAQTFEDAGVKSIKFDDNIYKKAGLEPIPLSKSTDMLNVLKADIIKTNGNLKNLTLTTANTSQQAFIQASNLAHTQITSGAFDYNTAIKNAVKSASGDGLKVIYPSGHVNTLEVAVRRAVMTGASQTTGKMQEIRLKEMGQDLVITSQHSGARKSHQIWQNKIFSFSGTSKKYPSLEEGTGYGTLLGLKGVNCAHDMYPWFEGISEKEATLKEQYVTYNNKRMTEYDASQLQRKNETAIRKWKREASSLDSAKQDNSFEKSKVREYQAKQRDLLKQTGLRRDSNREQIA